MDSKPNIIFLQAHNTGRFIEPYGHSVPTPHLMEMARNGVVFRNSFSAAPTCSPGRAAFLTGEYPHSCGMLGLSHRGWQLNDQSHHIAENLSAHGYHSALCGIEHVVLGDWGLKENGAYDEVLTGDNAYGKDLAPRAVDFLKRKHDKPFFLNVGTQETHTPFPDPEPEKFPAEDPNFCIPPRPFPDTPTTRQQCAAFKHSARNMDDCYGAVLDYLKESGLDKNTYVFAFCDHGLQWPLHIANVGEHGNAIFLLAQGPQFINHGTAIDSLVSSLDIYPTVCELTGMEHKAWLQGKSLLPLVNGDSDCLHEELFFEQTYHAAYEPCRAVRGQRYIYIRRYDKRDSIVKPNCDDNIVKSEMIDQGWEQQQRHEEALYDTYFDPDQHNNIIDKHAELAQTMSQQLDQWMEKTDDPLRHGPVQLPKGVGAFTTNPDAYSPREDPLTFADG